MGASIRKVPAVHVFSPVLRSMMWKQLEAEVQYPQSGTEKEKLTVNFVSNTLKVAVCTSYLYALDAADSQKIMAE